MWTPVPAGRVAVEDGFWGPRRQRLRTVTLHHQWEQLENCGNVQNLRITAGRASGVPVGLLFADSDLWKWSEAACYVLGEDPADAVLARRVAEVVELAAAAQDPDGYLNTYHQAFAGGLRWASLLLNHELYCAGHLIEAACAHHEATGSQQLLGVARRLADHVVSRFETDDAVPGHEEIELALARLAGVTHDPAYMAMAARFVARRGRRSRYPRVWLAALAVTLRIALRARLARSAAGVPSVERDHLGFVLGGPGTWPRILAQLWTGTYFQDAVPLREAAVAEGHAVRALYLLAGATDVAVATRDGALLGVLERIWRRTVARRSYVTGGAGALPLVEGFGHDWELPNRSYAETCSAVASLRFSQRLLAAGARTADTHVGDWMERTLYNGVLSGISLSGDRFFYQNPLESHGEHERQPWFRVACCPPNIARTLAALGASLWTEDGGGMQLHVLAGNTARFDRPGGPVQVTVTSALPWSGQVSLAVSVPAGSAAFTLALRVPAWAGTVAAARNGSVVPGVAAGRYLELEGPWADGDTVDLVLGLAPRWLPSPPQVKENRGRVALLYGPLVYCAEGVDNPGLDVHAVEIDTSDAPVATWQADLLGGAVAVDVATTEGQRLRLVPYYAWCNRGRTDMAVWLRAA